MGCARRPELQLLTVVELPIHWAPPPAGLGWEKCTASMRCCRIPAAHPCRSTLWQPAQGRRPLVVARADHAPRFLLPQPLAMRAAAVQASATAGGQASSRPAKPQSAPLAAVPARAASAAPRPHRASQPRLHVAAGAAAVDVTQVCTAADDAQAHAHAQVWLEPGRHLPAPATLPPSLLHSLEQSPQTAWRGYHMRCPCSCRAPPVSCPRTSCPPLRCGTEISGFRPLWRMWRRTRSPSAAWTGCALAAAHPLLHLGWQRRAV